MSRRGTAIAGVVVTWLLGGALACAGEHEIRLDRPFRAGDQLVIGTMGEFPLDTSVPRLGETGAWTTSLQIEVPTPEAGKSALLELSASRRVSRTFTIAGIVEADRAKPFLLGARHRRPGCLVASQGAAFEEGGVRLVGQTLSTRDARFFENDFVVDLVFALPADRGIVCIDFGGGGRKYPLRLRIHSAGSAPSGVDLSKNERG